jgi:hypothetical protein
MVARNHNYRFQRSAHPVPPAHQVAERLRHYFEQNPQVSREDFLLAAIQKEMEFRAADTVLRTWRGNIRPQGRGPNSWDNIYRPTTPDDSRIHLWLAERMLLLDRERHSWRKKLRRALLRNPLVNWVRSQFGVVATARDRHSPQMATSIGQVPRSADNGR